MNYFGMPGTVSTSKDFIITNDPIIIGCLVMYPSGEIVEIKSHSMVEQANAINAKLVRIKQSSLDTVGKQVKKSFRPMMDLGAAFEKMKRDIIFKHNIK